MQFRVVSYNIHKGIGGMDRRYRPERIIETMHHYDPDIVLMQEVDDGVPRSRRHRQVDHIGDALNYRYRAFQANVTLRRGRYGNALLSRFPLAEVHDIDLTIRMKKRRRAQFVKVTVELGGHKHTLVIVSLHLGLSGIERRMQLRRLLSYPRVRRVRRHTPLIIGGDFNDVWGTLGKRILHPAGLNSVAGRLNTFPAALPVRPLDHMYYRGPLTVTSAFVGHTTIAKQASDHRPLIVDFTLHQ